MADKGLSVCLSVKAHSSSFRVLGPSWWQSLASSDSVLHSLFHILSSLLQHQGLRWNLTAAVLGRGLRWEHQIVERRIQHTRSMCGPPIRDPPPHTAPYTRLLSCQLQNAAWWVAPRPVSVWPAQTDVPVCLKALGNLAEGNSYPHRA